MPGGIVTEGTKNVAKDLLKLKVGITGDGVKFNARLPIGRFGRPDEVALVLSSYVNGAIVAVDGGFLSS